MSRAKSDKRGFIRGGNWNNGTNAGAFTLNLNNTPTNTNTNIGFRVARSLRSTAVLVPLAGMPPFVYGRRQRAPRISRSALSWLDRQPKTYSRRVRGIYAPSRRLA